jgi:hypothetical protein
VPVGTAWAIASPPTRRERAAGHRAVLARRQAGSPAEERAEEGAVLVADDRCNLLRRHVAGLEQAHGRLDAQVLDVGDTASS